MYARALILALAASLAACSSENDPVKLPPPAAQAPGGHGAMAQMPAEGVPMPASAQAASSLQYTVPQGWVAETPSNAMRVAQFRLPKEGAEPEDAQLILFFFRGEGGAKQDNLRRWAGQFSQPDGRDSMQAMQTSTRTVDGMDVTEASVTGTLDTQAMPGVGENVRKEHWRMLAAIIETPSGPYFAKLTGPEATVGRWEASFRTWVSSMKKSG